MFALETQGATVFAHCTALTMRVTREKSPRRGQDCEPVTEM